MFSGGIYQLLPVRLFVGDGEHCIIVIMIGVSACFPAELAGLGIDPDSEPIDYRHLRCSLLEKGFGTVDIHIDLPYFLIGVRDNCAAGDRVPPVLAGLK
jgi:hypothetical protein